MPEYVEIDPWELADAPAMGEGIVHIDRAKFGFQTDYNKGETLCMMFEGTVVPEGSDETFPWNKLYPVGGGWEAVDGGARIQRENGIPKQIFKTSKYGFFIDGAKLSGAAQVLKAKGSPLEAHIWEDMDFEMSAKDHDYGGEIGKKATLIPVRYIPSDIAASGRPASTSASSTSASAAPTPPAAPSADYTVPASIKRKLVKLAKEHDTHEAFYDAAFAEIPEIDPSPELSAMVADSPDYYLGLKG